MDRHRSEIPRFVIRRNAINMVHLRMYTVFITVEIRVRGEQNPAQSDPFLFPHRAGQVI